jgi:hypothetical protein
MRAPIVLSLAGLALVSYTAAAQSPVIAPPTSRPAIFTVPIRNLPVANLPMAMLTPPVLLPPQTFAATVARPTGQTAVAAPTPPVLSAGDKVITVLNSPIIDARDPTQAPIPTTLKNLLTSPAIATTTAVRTTNIVLSPVTTNFSTTLTTVPTTTLAPTTTLSAPTNTTLFLSPTTTARIR